MTTSSAALKRRREPIAIVGMGCRFPGASDLQGYWQLLREGIDAVTEVPSGRWDIDSWYDSDLNAPHKTNSRWGGFVSDVEQFDWRAFGISPREARQMDPQHRLLLEVAAEAIDDAGIVRSSLVGKRVGVYVGVMWNDYFQLQVSDLDQVGPYSLVGNGLAFAANRISHFFDLRGPSFAIEVGCASSLQAIHQACQSLWSGESQSCLAGGVNLMLSPRTNVVTAKGGVFSPEGKCKTFDASADGFVPAEGAGVIVLKPHSRAVADGDRIYATILGSAANHNGKTPWIMAVDSNSQQSLFESALSSAEVEAHEVDYVELHGTGTRLGDPVEARAVGEMIGQRRPPDSPCYVGSVKSNIGHPESAGGVAHTIKVALSLYHQQLPASIHCNELNPSIDEQALGIRLNRELREWPPKDGAHIALVNALSLGGGNACIVMQQAARAEARRSAAQPGPYLLALSGHDADALEGQIQRMQQQLESSGPEDLYDICYTASVRRSHYSQRVACVGGSREALLEQLGAGVPAEISGNVLQVFCELDPVELCRSLGGVADFVSSVESLGKQAPGTVSFDGLARGDCGRALGHAVAQLALSDVLDRWCCRASGVVGLGLGELAAACWSGAIEASTAFGHARSWDSGSAAPARAAWKGHRRVPVVLGSGEQHGGWQAQPDCSRAAAAVREGLAQLDKAWLLVIGQQDSLRELGGCSVVDHASLLRAIARLHRSGQDVEFGGLFSAEARCVSLPSYAWHRQHLWLKQSSGAKAAEGDFMILPPETGVRCVARRYRKSLTQATLLEMLLQVVRQLCGEEKAVSSAVFHQWEQDGPLELQIVLGSAEDNPFQVYGRAADSEQPWVLYLEGQTGN